MYEQNYFGGQSQIHHQQPQIGYQSTQKMHRSISNSNVNSGDGGGVSGGGCHVEYEVSMPVPIIRHAPYHSLWNLHQW